jgi:hypothetical protein
LASRAREVSVPRATLRVFRVRSVRCLRRAIYRDRLAFGERARGEKAEHHQFRRELGARACVSERRPRRDGAHGNERSPHFCFLFFFVFFCFLFSGAPFFLFFCFLFLFFFLTAHVFSFVGDWLGLLGNVDGEHGLVIELALDPRAVRIVLWSACASCAVARARNRLDLALGDVRREG